MSQFPYRAAEIALSSIVGLAILIAAAMPASAACPPSVTPAESPAGPQTIGSNSECTVEPGASIATTNDNDNGITADDNNTIVNRGVITTTGGDADGVEANSGNSVLNAGTISTSGDISHGISVNDDNTAVNDGRLSTSGNNSFGIFVDDNNTVINRGVISTSGDGGVGIGGISAVNDGIIANSGIITTTGTNAFGINVRARNRVTNTGTISTSGFNAGGILTSDDSIVVNSGIVTTTGNSARGVDLDDEGNSFTNSGVIRTTGNSADGVAAGNGNVIKNSGLISTSGFSADAFIVGGSNTINNSGAIVTTGADSFAVRLVQTDNTLNLLQNSRVVGLIAFEPGIGIDNAVTLGRGENWLMTFNEDPRLNNSINTAGVPTVFLNGGLTVATFDVATTVFSAQAAALYDLTETINAGLHQRLTAGNPTTYIWAQGFGGKRNAEEAGGSFVRAAGDNDFSGGMAGFSTPLGASARGGLFGGYAEGSIESQQADSVGDNSRRHVIDQESWFGGAYGRAFWGQTFADVIVTGGETDNNSARRILNNLAPTGVEFARGSYDGWFINPELTLGVEMPLGGDAKLVPSASVGYAGLYLDGLKETGSQAAIALAARDVELIDGRLQVELRNKGETSAGLWQTALRAGIKGRNSIGDDNLAGVLAATTAFIVTMEDSDDVLAGFVGADLTFAVAPGVQVFAGTELAFEDDGDSVYTGRAGAAIKF